MRWLGAILCAAALLAAQSAWAGDVFVNGYFRSDGTYVQPHYRSAPDNSYNNNWSVSPNVNPYTGQRGTLSPTWDDNPPSDSYGSYGSNCGLLDPNC